MIDQGTTEKINSDECPLLDICAAVILSNGSGRALMALFEVLRSNLGEVTMKNLLQNKEQIERRSVQFWQAQANRDAEMFKRSKPKPYELSPADIEPDRRILATAIVA